MRCVLYLVQSLLPHTCPRALAAKAPQPTPPQPFWYKSRVKLDCHEMCVIPGTVSAASHLPSCSRCQGTTAHTSPAILSLLPHTCPRALAAKAPQTTPPQPFWYKSRVKLDCHELCVIPGTVSAASHLPSSSLMTISYNNLYD
ncbi:hypothetical protein J6590_011564 [Homalodisca vitripennis]|nr:hypothetical protein J6590_011564 [Homalodisca vitripennis]